MTTELWLLFWSLPLYGLYLGAQSLILRAQRGIMFAASSRDDPPPKSDLEARADRALRNFQETWLVFVILILIAHLAMPGDPLIFWGAIVWGVARLAYLPPQDPVQIGIMCCSPEREGFEVTFRDFTVGPAIDRALHED